MEVGAGSEILHTAALLGQMTLTAEEAAKAAKLRDLTEDEAKLLTLSRQRGEGVTMPPTDRPADLPVL